MKLVLGLTRIILLLFAMRWQGYFFHLSKNGHILRGGEYMQVKGFILNYKKKQTTYAVFLKIRELV